MSQTFGMPCIQQATASDGKRVTIMWEALRKLAVREYFVIHRTLDSNSSIGWLTLSKVKQKYNQFYKETILYQLFVEYQFELILKSQSLARVKNIWVFFPSKKHPSAYTKVVLHSFRVTSTTACMEMDSCWSLMIPVGKVIKGNVSYFRL